MVSAAASQHPLSFFATDAELAVLESTLRALPAAISEDRLRTQAALSWQLRQRDTGRALALADEVDGHLQADVLSGATEARRLAARLMLVRAEADWLFARLDAAKARTTAAQEAFAALDDAIGIADAHWATAMLAQDVGDVRGRSRAAAAMQAAAQGVDVDRCQMAEVALAYWSAWAPDSARHEEAMRQIGVNAATLSTAVACWMQDFWGAICFKRGNLAESIRHTIAASTHALASGQIRRAIVALSNTGDRFSSLNDYDTALVWMERGLALARRGGWPGPLGVALLHTAGTLRKLRRLDAAHSMLTEALQRMEPLAGSRNYAGALSYLAELELDRGAFDRALTAFERLAERAAALGSIDLQSEAMRGRAQALLGLQQLPAALAAAQAALAFNPGANEHQIDMRLLLADLHAAPGLPAGHERARYLQEALDLARQVDGMIVPSQILEKLAAVHADGGDFQRAYAFSQSAMQARERSRSLEAGNRAIAIEVAYETEQIRADAEHQRQLAEALAGRAKLLEEANRTLEHLGSVGRDITANLGADAIFAALQHHVHGLLDANTLMIYRLEEEQQQLTLVFGVEAERPIPPHFLSLADPQSLCARCARELREIVIHESPDSAGIVAGTLDTQSLMYAPLLVGQRLLGVMSIQALRPHAYREREIAIFRTLCAYGAIALANAEAQEQILQARKLASLGRLVTGMAHELNTPIGNAVIAASTLEENAVELARAVERGELKKSTLTAFLQNAIPAAQLIERSCQRAGKLVTTFKQIATEQASAQRHPFDLRTAVDGALAVFQKTSGSASLRVSSDVPEGILCDTYPASLHQVLAHLLDNAATHAFDGSDGGTIRVAAQVKDGTVRLQVSDDGKGMSADTLAKVFDPFFTTQLGIGGPGLGLTVALNIATGILGGSLQASSELGRGSSFTLKFPLAAPRRVGTATD